MNIKPVFLFRYAANDFHILTSKFYGWREYDASWFGEEGVGIVHEPGLDIQQEEIICKSEEDAMEELARQYAKQYLRYHLKGLAEHSPEMTYQDFTEHLLNVLEIESPIKLEY